MLPGAVLFVLSACASPSHRAATTTAPTTTAPAPTTTPTTTAPTTTAPTPTATTTTASAAFSGTITTVSAGDLASTYRPGCPVGPVALRMLHMSYWGFDDRPHLGTMVVNVAVTSPVLRVFAMLFRSHFPIRRMEPVAEFGGSDPASMAADNTSGFNCRPVPGSHPPAWSAHAYGEAIDVNTVENPYLAGGRVQPDAGAAYLDRSRLRAGMAAPGTVLNNAFASIGWLWGGRWSGSPDYQHFSKTGG
jgi:D-alanyl-D-alanine carboxypeptidase